MTEALKKRCLFQIYLCIFRSYFIPLSSFFLSFDEKQQRQQHQQKERKYLRYDVDRIKNIGLFAQICGQIELTAEIVSVFAGFFGVNSR